MLAVMVPLRFQVVSFGRKASTPTRFLGAPQTRPADKALQYIIKPPSRY